MEESSSLIRSRNVIISPSQSFLDAEEATDNEDSWASPYTVDFRKRLVNLLGYEFRSLPCSLAL